jgi:hypothetical protein
MVVVVMIVGRMVVAKCFARVTTKVGAPTNLVREGTLPQACSYAVDSRDCLHPPRAQSFFTPPHPPPELECELHDRSEQAGAPGLRSSHAALLPAAGMLQALDAVWGHVVWVCALYDAGITGERAYRRCVRRPQR